MTILRYQPATALRRFQDEVNRLLDQDLGVVVSPTGEVDRSRVATSQWTPAVDVREAPDRYLITADVPGVAPEDIEITMDAGVLTIKGERKHAAEEAGGGFRRVERVFGSFYRRFSLPDTADGDAISARSHNGVLEVSIPKKAAAQPRRIQVQ